MDVETVLWLLPFVLAGAFAGAGVHRRNLAWMLVALWLSVIGLVVVLTFDVGCVWEGTADGPLPIECRRM